MPRKMIQFDRETLVALDDLAGDRMATFQELADEAFADLLKKHRRPVGFKQSLKASARPAKAETGRAARKRRTTRRR